MQLAANAAFFQAPGVSPNTRTQNALGIAVASANNLTLGNDGNVFHITGTTTINLLNALNWQAGSEVNLIFDGSVTVKHNQTLSTTFTPLLLSGSADLSAVANTRLKLIYDGSNWLEFSRTTA